MEELVKAKAKVFLFSTGYSSVIFSLFWLLSMVMEYSNTCLNLIFQNKLAVRLAIFISYFKIEFEFKSAACSVFLEWKSLGVASEAYYFPNSLAVRL